MWKKLKFLPFFVLLSCSAAAQKTGKSFIFNKLSGEVENLAIDVKMFFVDSAVYANSNELKVIFKPAALKIHEVSGTRLIGPLHVPAKEVFRLDSLATGPADTLLAFIDTQSAFDLAYMPVADSHYVKPLPLSFYLLSTDNEHNALNHLFAAIAFYSGLPLNKIKIVVKCKNYQAVFSFQDELLMEKKPMTPYNPNPKGGNQELIVKNYDVSGVADTKPEDQKPSVISKYDAKIEKYMQATYGYLHGKFLYDQNHKYTFSSVPGLISGAKTHWELIELVIFYIPYTPASGQLNMVFNGTYVNASSDGPGPEISNLKHDGKPLEADYADQINSFLGKIYKGINDSFSK